jgi:hypothetical protein
MIELVAFREEVAAFANADLAAVPDEQYIG